MILFVPKTGDDATKKEGILEVEPIRKYIQILSYFLSFFSFQMWRLIDLNP